MAPAAQRPPGPFPNDDLDARARRVLSAVVRDYVEGGEPVGSKVIARRPELEASAATVRAVMADLEALGYLEKPHTSAGRVPTPLGYRYYVDALLHRKAPRPGEKQLIEKRTQDAARQMDGLFAEASRLLHSLTRHAGVVAAPRAQGDRLQRIEFVALREGRVLAVLITRLGAVQNRLLAPAPGQAPLTPAQLVEGANWLNGILGDLTLQEARARLSAELARARALLEEVRERTLALGVLAVDQAAGAARTTPLIMIEGQSSLLEEPLLVQDLQKMRALFRSLDEKEQVLSVLDRALAAQELTIFIGAESGLSGAQVSIVAAPYRFAGELVGTLGVIGPTRMDYARVIPLVEFTARTVGIALGASADP
ncbi:MAG: heat-inducible transcriptional repressor HrcA [Myxococcales bacterium]